MTVGIEQIIFNYRYGAVSVRNAVSPSLSLIMVDIAMMNVYILYLTVVDKDRRMTEAGDLAIIYFDAAFHNNKSIGRSCCKLIVVSVHRRIRNGKRSVMMRQTTVGICSLQGQTRYTGISVFVLLLICIAVSVVKTLLTERKGAEK